MKIIVHIKVWPRFKITSIYIYIYIERDRYIHTDNNSNNNNYYYYHYYTYIYIYVHMYMYTHNKTGRVFVSFQLLLAVPLTVHPGGSIILCMCKKEK